MVEIVRCNLLQVLKLRASPLTNPTRLEIQPSLFRLMELEMLLSKTRSSGMYLAGVILKLGLAICPLSKVK